MNNSLKQYIELHDDNLDAINGHSAPQLNALRKEARKALENAVLPRCPILSITLIHFCQLIFFRPEVRQRFVIRHFYLFYKQLDLTSPW